MPPAPIAPRPQLLTYPDSLGGDLAALARLLDGPLAGLFRGVHVLPPFPSSGDRGFAPITYDEIDGRFGTWDDIARLARGHDVVLDVMINHISRRSAAFREFAEWGRAASTADLFLTLDKVWPGGEPPEADLAKLKLRKPGGPFTTITIERTGETERIWTTFGSADWSEQIDLDVRSAATRELITGWLRAFAGHGVRIVRLDAVGYVAKRAGTSGFMVEPEIYDFLAWLERVAAGLGLTLLPEVHDDYATHERLASQGFWTYDFVLPALVLHALSTGEARRLAEHLARSPERVFTTLDCHDGIPVRPDLDGILEPAEMVALTDRVVERGGNVSRLVTARTDEVDAHQLNITYWSALDADADRYLAARAIQLFARGVPQVYYVGLLAGANDPMAVEATLDGRAINRHDYAPDEIEAALERPVVQRLVELIRLRNTHPAFDGVLTVETTGDAWLRLSWANAAQDATCALEVDLVSGRATIQDGARAEPVAER
jgi:sucrose phosphorylase